jgi:hypothetical protein
MITISYTAFGPNGSVRLRETLDASYMDVRTSDKGEPILYVWTDEDEDELVGVFRSWDFAVRVFEVEEDPDDPAEAPGDNVVQIFRGEKAIYDEMTSSVPVATAWEVTG